MYAKYWCWSQERDYKRRKHFLPLLYQDYSSFQKSHFWCNLCPACTIIATALVYLTSRCTVPLISSEVDFDSPASSQISPKKLDVLTGSGPGRYANPVSDYIWKNNKTTWESTAGSNHFERGHHKQRLHVMWYHHNMGCFTKIMMLNIIVIFLQYHMQYPRHFHGGHV